MHRGCLIFKFLLFYLAVPRRYGQSCPLSRALDRLGGRWTLLILRELLPGPRRYGEILDALPGLGTNLLAARLRELDEAGLVHPSRGAYELAPGGRALAPALTALARWGLAHTQAPPAGEARGPAASPLALLALFDPERAEFDRICCAFRVDDRIFHVVAGRGGLKLGWGDATDADATLILSGESYRRLEEGLSPRRLLADGALRVEGSLTAFETLRRCFRAPASS